LPKLAELSKHPHKIQKDWENFIKFLYRSKPGIIETGIRRQWKLGRRKKKVRLKKAYYRFLRSSYRFMVSASLLLSEIKRIVFPPSSMMGNLF
jgi:hypothetical protein